MRNLQIYEPLLLEPKSPPYSPAAGTFSAPQSPALTYMTPTEARSSYTYGVPTEVRSSYTYHAGDAEDARYHTRSPSLGTECLLHDESERSSRYLRTVSDAESPPSTRPSSPSYTRPNTHSPHVGLETHRFPTRSPSTSSFGLLTRPGTPGPSTAALLRPTTPPAVVQRLTADYHRGTRVVYRPATPDSLMARAGPSKMRLPPDVRIQRQPTYHSDSGFRYSRPLPTPVPSVSGAIPARESVMEKEERQRDEITLTPQRMSCSASAISEVPPMYTAD